MISVAEALAIGTRHHQAGQLAEAERIYRQILESEPDHPDALHQMGILTLQARNFEAAVDLLDRAVRRDRSRAAFHANLGEAYRHLGRPMEAEKCYQNALKLQPDLAEVQTMLGTVLRTQGRHAEAAVSLRKALQLKAENTEARTQLGHALQDQNKLEEAEACFRRVVRTDSRSATAQFNLGNCLQVEEKIEEAVACYRTALELNPAHFEAHNNLGTILNGQGLSEEAEVHYHAAIKVKPDCGVAHTNLGAIYFLRGQIDEAVACYRSALAADPGIELARYNLGTLLQQQGHLEEALACFLEVVRVNPQHAPAHVGAGSVLKMQGKPDVAITYCREAIRLDPGNADAYNNMGVAWSEQGRRDEGVEYCRRAIELRPGFATAHGNLGASLQYIGRLDEAIVHLRKSVELEPGNSGFQSNLIYLLNYHPAYDAASLFAEHRAWGQRHADPLTARSAAHANARTLARRLRVGYVSPNFKDQAVNFFSEPILASHDHAQCEVFCYSDVAQPDPTTRRLQAYADHWRDTVLLGDQQLSELVRRDQIDILVDLTGHIGGGGRMLVFARKPAPIQVTYIGYQNTTGMLAMDYRLTDDYADPQGLTDAFHTEKLVRLPRTFFCYLPSSDAPAVTPLPARSNGFVTFASINNFNKITPEVLTTWAEILASVPQSRLLVRADMTDWLRQHLVQTFAGHGIGAERLELVNRVRHREYLELIGRIDIALDPFPFNGHTTTCDCLWQGVPVVTLSGDRYASRFGGSGLATLGLDDLIATTREQYVEIARGLAADLDRLARLRGGLRQRMADSPLLDFQTFTRNLEAAYRRMWADWCADAVVTPAGWYESHRHGIRR